MGWDSGRECPPIAYRWLFGHSPSGRPVRGLVECVHHLDGLVRVFWHEVLLQRRMVTIIVPPRAVIDHTEGGKILTTVTSAG